MSEAQKGRNPRDRSVSMTWDTDEIAEWMNEVESHEVYDGSWAADPAQYIWDQGYLDLPGEWVERLQVDRDATQALWRSLRPAPGWSLLKYWCLVLRDAQGVAHQLLHDMVGWRQVRPSDLNEVTS